MPRKTFSPISKKQGDREIRRDWTQFTIGMMDGPPVWPDGAVNKLVNAVAYPRWIQGRFGTSTYKETAIPKLPGRDHYTATKSGSTITSDDAGFTLNDISNYWVWPDGRHDEIVELVSSTQVKTRDEFDRDRSLNCYMRGKHNGWIFHKQIRKIVAQFGTDFYVADNLGMSSWTRLVGIDPPLAPNNAVSDFDEFDDDVVCFNSNGLYRLVVDTLIPRFYRFNNNVPSQPVDSITQTDELPYGRRYIYTATRMAGETTLRDRGDVGAKIMTEGGPNAVDSEKRDYGEVWTAYKIGDDTKTRGRVEGDAVTALDAVGTWSIVESGTFSISINGRSHVVWVDFTGVGTMQDVAKRIQSVMKIYWPDSTCVFNDDGKFELTSGDVNGSTLESIGAGTGGTDIAQSGYMNVVDSTPETEIFARPSTITLLRVPLQDDGTPHECYTHFSIYGTQDVGVNGTDPVTGEGNDPERYVWLHDLRTCAAFYASKETDGMVTAHKGKFEPADVGSPLVWDDGDRDTIATYIDETHVTVSRAPYVEDQKEFRAAAIGDGGFTLATQSGDIITRAGAADGFGALKAGSTIHWSSGYRSYVRTVLSPTQVRVWDTGTRVLQGVTWQPLYRNFNDRIDDDTVRNRIKFLSMKNRLWEKIPSGNMGRVMPGWMFVATRSTKKFYYSQLPTEYQYLAGYYFAGYQFNEDVNDSMQSIQEFQDRIVIYCAKSVYAGATNTSTPFSIPTTGQFINVLNGMQPQEAHIGILDWGSIVDIDTGKQIVVTSEPGVRVFDGFKFGPNLAETGDGYELVMNYLRRWVRATASAFKDGVLYLWGLTE